MTVERETAIRAVAIDYIHIDGLLRMAMSELSLMLTVGGSYDADHRQAALNYLIQARADFARAELARRPSAPPGEDG